MINRLYLVVGAVVLTACTYKGENSMLRYAMNEAGDNRSELKAVLEHYNTSDPSPHKLMAAKYLIAGLPAHYSYADSSVYEYYSYAASILVNSSLTPEQQRDSLLIMTDSRFADLPKRTVPDAKIIKADYLIRTIDQSYEQWNNCPWSSHITFDEYLEWLLPYKAVELQELDGWRDTLLVHFGDGLLHPIKNDVEYNTVMGVSDMLRNEAFNQMQRYGLYTRSGLPLLSAYLLPRQTYGNIPDYAVVAVLLMRAAGIPAVLDETPVGSRFTAATHWYVILDDRGQEQTSEWDLSTMIGGGFFPYDRGPKVYRNTHAVNMERFEYRENSIAKYPFELGKQDVTSIYFLTSDLSLPIMHSVAEQLAERWVYIASAVRTESVEPLPQDGVVEFETLPNYGWQIVDLGKIRGGRARFNNMGREVLYRAYGYNGTALIPVTEPFILHKDGGIEYICTDTLSSPHLDQWKNNAL